VFFLTFVGGLLMSEGFVYDAETKVVSMVPYHYAASLLAMPVVAVIFLLGVICVLLGIYKAWFDFDRSRRKAIWWSGFGTVATVFALFLLSGYNQAAFYPSTHDLQSSLTIENASSSRYTLVAMGYASLMVPFVVAYIWYVWKALNNTPITVKEMDDDDHAY
jgi:cytochrome d ubiquinol oxidase subunit II